ncbi:unnamed protein product [Clonostachys rosea f. rosea IK726]|uniref:NAD-dependent epimerase/dehydratase domain-containing protein n=2 Tax=Bionectria ochroleuca TaxID=29856 RepID=A0A0B7JTA1_BIOOC|nr:unnamed protein product [Clonostachys rosea f. rosea IK726]
MSELPYSAQTILVTGANGYIALHIIKQLLDTGYNVRGTVRSEAATEKVRNAFPQYWGRQLEIVRVAILIRADSYVQALDDKITAVVHAASPVHGAVEDNVCDMLEPAIQGATAILSAISQMPSSNCRRVVQMSSFSAILDPAKGLRPGYTYTDKDWNPVSYDEAVTIQNSSDLYLASKALSERAVWDWVKQQSPVFDVVCLNPSFVLGPHVDRISSPNTVSTGAMLWSIIDSESIPPLLFGGYVDVRDLAKVTAAALEIPEVAGERFLVAHHFDWQTASDLARESFPALRGRIPVGDPGTGEAKALKHIYQVDGTKVNQVLGIELRPLRETVSDSIQEFIELEQRPRAATP